MGVALGLPLTASAHALAQSSTPADGATVQQAPKQVVITFGQTPDPQLSSITVVDTSGATYDAGPTTAVAGRPLQLEVALKPLPKGVYTVTWATVSTVDGHRAAGAFAFGVGEAPGASAARAAASVQSPPPSWLAILARLVLFIGLLLMVGVASTSLLALAEVPAFATRLLLAGWVVTALATVSVAEAERESAGIGWAAVFSTSLGVTLLWRLIATVVAGLATAAAVLVGERRRRIAIAVAGLATAGGMWVDVAASHAGAEAPVAVNLALQWLHIVAAGVWIGGLFVLLLGIRGAPTEAKTRAARRFSTMALIAIVVLAATGVIRAVLEIQSWHQLVASPFGELVIVKVALLLVLAVLGGVNRFGSIPMVGTALHRLRRVASTEVVVGVAALLVTASLVNNSPPVEAAGSGGATAQQQQLKSLDVTGGDYSTTIKVHLHVTPGTAGFNTFTLSVTDYDTGKPITDDQVVLQFTMPLRPDVGPSSLTLQRQRDGSYQARGGNLSINGTWAVTALIQSHTAATEVHLQLTTISTPPTVTVQRFPKSPTLYTIQLSQGHSLQVYLDPDKPGSNEFHLTFFDPKAASGEMTITSASVAMTPPGGAAQVLALRRLDPVGHFVADVTAPAGKSRFDILATAASGEQVSTYIEIAPGT